jgi:2-dehydro-3-deoxyphosphooctonate aldolase (KDO 8-P synthase)
MTSFLNRLNEKLLVIAGPCVIEDDGGAITLQTAKRLSQIAEKLDIEFYFKSSYDKANRSSINSYRGPGLKKGLDILKSVKETYGLSLLTDVHHPEEAREAGRIIDMLQIPAFLCRQTDLLMAAGETGKAVNIKKGQFLSPKDVLHAAKKIEATGNNQIYITERGSSFGYNNLVVDMRSIPIIQNQGYPLIFDCTHSVQLPGGAGEQSSGEREYAPVLARAAIAAGCSGLFLETHPNPSSAPSDGANMLPLEWVEPFLVQCLQLRETLRKTTFDFSTLQPTS